MQELTQYLKDAFGEIIKPVQDREKTKNLPLYLKGNYDIFFVDIAGNKIILVGFKEQSSLTPDQLKKQAEQLSHYLNAPIVFVFHSLESWQRKRLIEKKIGFAEPFQQLYIPDLLLQIKDTKRRDLHFVPVSDKLQPAAQYLLLYHLQIGTLEDKKFQEIAGILQYSSMTITRAVKELAAFGLLKVKGSKEKSVNFNEHGRQLWEKALPHLDSPVREIWLSERDISNKYTRISGDSALAEYTMLSETNQKCLAIGKDAFRVLKNQPSYKDLNKNYGDFKLEVWHYDPLLLSDTNEIDKLSLYLSTQHDENVRVQAALRELINEMKW
jgi:DNA-binding MarR family transcriptional regulator